MFAKYAVNLTDNTVQLIDNKITIVGNGWRGLTQGELDHPDVIYAIRKDWIKLEEKQPKGPESPKRKPIKVYTQASEDYSGSKEPEAEKSVAKVSKLGT